MHCSNAYPIPVQYSKCLIAMTSLTVLLKFLTADIQKNLGIVSLVADCRKSLVICAEAMPRKKLSAGARRHMDAVFSRFAGPVGKLDVASDSYPTEIGSMLWAVASMIDDIRNRCPEYNKVRGWVGIWATLEAIVGAFEEKDEEVYYGGVGIYEDIE